MFGAGFSRPLMSWYQGQCPVRGPALTHVHHERAPACGALHRPEQCCECGRTPEDDFRPTPETPLPTQPPVPVVQKVEIVKAPVPYEDCPVDHKSINTALLIGDGGLEWRKCPLCDTHIEGAMATGNLPPAFAKGRMPITPREARHLETLRAAWQAGYYKS